MNNALHKRHKYDTIKSWINSPSDLDDADRYWCFSIIKECACGKTQKCTATIEDVKEFIKNTTCICGIVNSQHKTDTDCMNSLFIRVKSLESKLDKICNVLNNYE